MIIGIPKEVKKQEYRVGATPQMVRALVESGHQVRIQSGAGTKVGFNDDQFRAAGAAVMETPQEIYETDMIIKVKEPQEEEFPLLHEGQVLFCYLHLAPDPNQTRHLLEKKVVGIAYETVEDRQGHLPLLVPMSEIAGRVSVQVGATYLQMNNGGKGILLGGVPGVTPGNVSIIGGGIVGIEAARMALGLGAQVIVIDKNLKRLRQLDELFGPRLKTLYSSSQNIENTVIQSDLVIGAVLVSGMKPPKLVTREMISQMSPGSVVVDVAIDQGGCFETSRPTSHADPIFVVDGVVHYCVTNIPGACARTATMALTNATMDYALRIANKGYRKALLDDPLLRLGLNVCLGKVTNQAVAHDLGYPFVNPEEILAGTSLS